MCVDGIVMSAKKRLAGAGRLNPNLKLPWRTGTGTYSYGAEPGDGAGGVDKLTVLIAAVCKRHHLKIHSRGVGYTTVAVAAHKLCGHHLGAPSHCTRLCCFFPQRCEGCCMKA